MDDDDLFGMGCYTAATVASARPSALPQPSEPVDLFGWDSYTTEVTETAAPKCKKRRVSAAVGAKPKAIESHPVASEEVFDWTIFDTELKAPKRELPLDIKREILQKKKRKRMQKMLQKAAVFGVGMYAPPPPPQTRDER